jgi:hypothetical protein
VQNQRTTEEAIKVAIREFGSLIWGIRIGWRRGLSDSGRPLVFQTLRR